MKRQRSALAGFFVFRRPLLSLSVLVDLSSANPPTDDGDEVSFEEPWSRLLGRQDFSRAVRLQSPSLWAAITNVRAAGKRLSSSSVSTAVYRYAARSAWRAAPRGLFAAVGIGRVSDTPAPQALEAPEARVCIDFSLDYLGGLLAQIAEHESSRVDVPLVRNPTLVRFGDSIHLRSCRSGSGSASVATTRLEASALLQRMVESLGASPMHPADLRRWMAACDVPAAEFDARLLELTAVQILVPAIAICPVADDPVAEALCAIPDVASLRTIRDGLQYVRAAVRRHQRDPANVSLDDLESHCRTLPRVPGFEGANRIFNVETLYTGCDVRLTSQHVQAVDQAVRFLHRMFGDLGAARVDGVRQAFADRFGEATVPLQRLLDPEHGIGPIVVRDAQHARWARGGRRAALLRCLHDSLARGRQAVDLDVAFLARFDAGDLPPMPPACSALLRYTSPSTGDGEGSIARDMILVSVVGCVGSELWARHARNDPAFTEAWRTLCAQMPKEEAGVVRADVVLAPASGADLTSRPGSHSVRILCGPVAPRHGTVDLPLQDLHVQIVNERLCLVSRRLGREIQPVIGTSIDPSQVGSPVYRFLCLLAYQDWATPLKWDWGELDESPFLPCVRVGGVVLSPARWRIDEADLATATSTATGERGDRARWRAWCERLNLPRWAIVRDGDDSLPCDLWQPWGEGMVRQAVKLHGCALVESLSSASGGPRDNGVANIGGRLTELIVPMTYAQPDSSAERARSQRLRPQDWMGKFGEGVRLPGSDWLYAKLYASPSGIERLLRDELPALLQRLRDECAVRCWFFFRYRDTAWHLRLRLHVPHAAARPRAQEILESAATQLLSRESVWRLQFDTYFREIERFGGARACGLVEQFFAAESELALDALHAWADESIYDDAALQLAASWVAWTWDQLGLPRAEQLSLCNALARAHLRLSDAADLPLEERRAVAAAARAALRTRAAALHDSPFEELSATRGPWRRQCRRAARSLTALRQLADAGELTGGARLLGGNLSHLLVARLFAANHDAHESALYVQLSRLLRRRDRVDDRGATPRPESMPAREAALASS